MGIKNHNTVIAVTWDEKEIERVMGWVNVLKNKHKSLFLLGPITMNSKQAIVMVPDGSKEGWQNSIDCDYLRDEFILQLELNNHSDGSSAWDYVEVGFGEYGKKVLRCNCKNRYDDRDYAL